MADANPVHTRYVLGQLRKVLQSEPDNLPALCAIGRELSLLGLATELRKCYRAAVEVLQRAIRDRNAALALECEVHIYTHFVRNIEDEEHYYRSFRDWKDQMAALGRRARDPSPAPEGDPRRVAFFLHTLRSLGHVEVLFKLLESRPREGPGAFDPRIYVLGGCDAAQMERCRALGIEVVSVVEAMGRDYPRDRKFLWLRDRFRQDRIGICVWVSVPTLAAYALSMRLAPVQVFWSMRFHPLSGPYIDGYITWGAADETTRRYGNQDWQVVPLQLAIDDARPPQPEVAELRARFPEKVLLGTLAREDKINSKPFLQAVTDILAAHPHAGFLWTGQSEHPGISALFRDAGVAERCHFVGWVDTKLYAAALDAFLDTFPHGCGITSYQAFAASTPLLSYLGPYTIFGTHFWKLAGGNAEAGAGGAQPRLNAPDEHMILCARDGGEYAALAGRLIADAAWRAEVGARGRAFFEEELRRNNDYARRFFETLSRIAASSPRAAS